MKEFYTLSAREASQKGLTQKEFEKRLIRNGENKLPEKQNNAVFKILISQFKNPLVIVILVAMFFSFLIGHIMDAFFIVFVVFVNATVGFVQEFKAEKVLKKLSQSVKFYCRVLRDGRKKEELSSNLVTGDVVFLNEGDKIPADGRVVKSNGLKINESALTGEWLSIDKIEDSIKEEVALAERKNMVYMGGIVEGGSGEFVVTATGVDTELGKISQLVKNEDSPVTPLQEKLLHLSKILAACVLAAIGIFATIYIIRGESLYDVFITSIALVVSAIPEGLLPAITVILVLAMKRLVTKKALIRKLNATEGMGVISAICTDKTGTLTKGEMQVSHILTGTAELLGEKGNLKNIYNSAGLETHLRVLEIVALVNDAYIENPQDEFAKIIIRGRHTDSALLMASVQAGIEKEKLEKKFKLLQKIDFNSSNKYAARIYKTENNKIIICFLGSPEVVLGKSKQIHLDNKSSLIDEKKRLELGHDVEKLTKQGLRVLACAWKEIEENEYEKKDYTFFLDDLDFMGFVALKDPIRKDVKKSLEIAKKAGIKTFVITGDHKNTAKAIVNELGMNVNEDEILEGWELDKLSDKKLAKIIEKIIIFARVSPEHKIRIVRALQENGEIVAMVGDGVNDAPAIKASNVGISVGTGTDIAKEVSSIVLLDNSFSVIVKAIEQGRVARENIKRTVIYLIADDFSELFLFFFAVIVGLPFPLYPIQILWINLVEDSFPNIALTTENNTDGIMDEKPINPKEPLIGKFYKKFIFAVFAVSGLSAASVFYLFYNLTGDIDKARTVIFALVAFDSLTFAYIIKSFKHSVFNPITFSNKYLNWSIGWALVVLIGGIHIPFFQSILKVSPIGMKEWGIVLGVSLTELLILEIAKYVFIIKKRN
ncbi:MAG: Cation transport ATPase [Candidatus Moranbacteria bacterium GW2011_GWF2_34_56]|nr:MAG: Cation transport ATPase [Candidatus Moranbacteria bacterium GW2011_GWF2_34_56]